MDTQHTQHAQQEINFLDIFLVCLKRKRLILGGSLGVAVLTLAACFIMTPVFRGTVAVMPLQTNASSSAAQLLSQFSGVASMVLGAQAGTTGNLYVGIVQTQAVLDPIITRFGLMKLYRLDTIEDARDYLLNDVLAASMDSLSGVVTITADDRDPQRAADIANAFAEELKRVFDSVASTDAGRRRIFFESQLKKAHEDLTNSEINIRNFAETTGALRIDEQASATLQGIMTIRNSIAVKEVQISVMKTFAAKGNPDLKRSEQEVQALKAQLKKLEDKQDITTPGVIIPTDQIPDLGMEYLRKYRDFKYFETLYELIVKQYEAARIDEAREASPVQLINTAVKPTKKAKPKMLLLTIIDGAAAFMLFTLIAFFVEVFNRASRSPEQRDRVVEMRLFARRA
jgi:tyrosine-protein kinase Etk/Wzc